MEPCSKYSPVMLHLSPLLLELILNEKPAKQCLYTWSTACLEVATD